MNAKFINKPKAILVLSITLLCAPCVNAHNKIEYSSDPVRALISIEEEFNTSLSFFNEQKYEQALAGFHKVATLKPDAVEAHFNIGLINLITKNYDAAITAFETTTTIDRNNSQSFLYLASLWENKGHYEKSINALKRVLTLNPTNINACVNLAHLYEQTGQLDNATQTYQTAIRHSPDNSALIFEAGCFETKRGNTNEAMSYFKKILMLEPHHPEAHFSIAHILTYLGRTKEAIPHLRNVVIQWPEHKDAHKMLGEAYLATGDLLAGFKEREWRLANNTTRCATSMTYWHNENIQDKTILIRDEEAIADAIQFIRYAALLKNNGAKCIILETKNLLAPLMETNPYINEIVPIVTTAQQLPQTDIQIPMASLPYIFKTTEETIPNQTPYIHPPHAMNNYWKLRMAHNKKFKIGIAWQDTKQSSGNISEYTVPLAPLLSVIPPENVTIYLLQPSATATEMSLNMPHAALPQINTLKDLELEEHDLGGISALMNNLDLIISADNDFAHLAGALAKPVWVLLPKITSWRWMQHQMNTPWYPTMQLFQQYRHGMWHDVINQIGDTLQAMPALTTPSAITAEVPVGELIDKMTILEIKLKKITDEKKLVHIKNELSALTKTYNESVTPSKQLATLTKSLSNVNEQLWDIEDAIRTKEREKSFDADFIALAREVYQANDKRGHLKQEINALLGSRLCEVKEYASY